MTTPVSPQIALERVRMALSDSGYDPTEAGLNADGAVEIRHWTIPHAVIWTAFHLADPDDTACWSCWMAGIEDGDKCARGDCQHTEGPARPPRTSQMVAPSIVRMF